MSLALVLGTAVGVAPHARADQADAALIAKGEYLATAGDCAACHTAPNGQKFAGGLMMNMPFGVLSTPNITPDKETGIGTWSADDFYRVMHEGRGKDGEHLYPAMPYPWYAKVTREDSDAIRAYLLSIPAVNAPRKPSNITFPFNIRAGLAVWDVAFLKEGSFKPDPTKSDAINRGAYLVEGLGHCGECHNKQNLAGDTGLAERLQGGVIDHWYAPNITSDVRSGIGRFSDAQLASYLKTGSAAGMGTVLGPMAQTVHESLSKLTDKDIGAMVAYLKSTPAAPDYTQQKVSDVSAPHAAGSEAYLTYCASCHQLDGKGIASRIPALAGNGVVTTAQPQTVIRVIVGGVMAQNTYAPMPAIGVGMTDQQVADVTNYVRQAWGNAAPPNAGPGDVATLRKETRGLMTGTSAAGGEGCPTLAQADMMPSGTSAGGGPGGGPGSGQSAARGQAGGSGIARILDDPSTGVRTTLAGIDATNMLDRVDQVLAKVKSLDPKLPQADIVNGLTVAYCPVVAQDPKLDPTQRIVQLNQFSSRVYSQIASNGKD